MEYYAAVAIGNCITSRVVGGGSAEGVYIPAVG